MKKLQLLILLLLITSKVPAQEWFPIGASWYYNQVDWLLMGERYKYFKVTGDTIIQDKYCRIIHGECECSEFDGVNYLYAEGDQIYYYDQAGEVFKILYDFSLLPGDTLRYFSNDYGGTKYVLDSISTILAGPLNLRVQHFKWIEGVYELGDKVYELIGSDRCLYPLIGVCDPGTGPLRCYEDTLVGIEKFIDADIPCDYITSSTVDLRENPVKIFPVPAHGSIQIESTTIIASLELIYMQSGKCVMQLKPGLHKISLATSSFPAGVYIFRIEGVEGQFYVNKVVLL